LLGLVAPSALRANEITNGNFAAGGLGWSTTQTDGNYPWGFGYNGSYYYASTGCIGQPCITGPVGNEADLFQDITTVAGDSYTLSFSYLSEEPTNELEALFGSTVALDLPNLDTTSLVNYTVSGLVATSTTTEVDFLGRQDPSFDELTNVDVENNGPATVTPEPSSMLLFGTFLAGAFGAVRRKLRV
jgi:hypothetical protein